MRVEGYSYRYDNIELFCVNK